jgi:hypothetical protein
MNYKIDLIGKKFGTLLIVKELPLKRTYRRWLCLCDCGTQITTDSYFLLKGKSKSCGLNCACKKIDLIGKKFGKLTVEEKIKKTNSLKNEGIWLCKCNCGKYREVRTYKLLNGKITHCGCEFNPIIYKDRTIPVKKSLYSNYKIKADKKKLQFDLTFDQFISLMSLNCYYCNNPPSNKRILNKQYKTLSEWVYNGIDRKNNLLGYTILNCVPCCYTCNSAKNSMGLQSFISWGKKLGKNLNEKQ